MQTNLVGLDFTVVEDLIIIYQYLCLEIMICSDFPALIKEQNKKKHK